MTSQNALARPAATQPDAAAIGDEAVTIETRFGALSFRNDALIRMPRGLLGYSGHQVFGLAAMPDPALERFKVLQSMDDPALSFIVLPLEPGDDSIETGDRKAACRMLSIEFADSVTLLVVSTRAVGEATQISVNMRAPILLDAGNRRAWQYVLPNNRYPVRQVIATARPRDG